MRKTPGPSRGSPLQRSLGYGVLAFTLPWPAAEVAPRCALALTPLSVAALAGAERVTEPAALALPAIAPLAFGAGFGLTALPAVPLAGLAVAAGAALEAAAAPALLLELPAALAAWSTLRGTRDTVLLASKLDS